MKFRLPKWAMAIIAAILYLPLVADWCVPGVGLDLAAGWLGKIALPVPLSPIWGQVVRVVGGDVVALGCISALGAFACLIFLSAIFGDLFATMRRLAARSGAEGESCFEYSGAIATGMVMAAFVVSPGVLVAATRVGPFTLSLAISLASVAMLTHLLRKDGDFGLRACAAGALAAIGAWHDAVGIGFMVITVLLLLRKGVRHEHNLVSAIGWWVLGALIGFVLVPTLFIDTGWHGGAKVIITVAKTLPGAFFGNGMLCFGLLGVAPALALMSFIRSRRIASPRHQLMYFSVWALAVLAMLAVVIATKTLSSGQVVSRVVARVIGNAEGCRAVVSDGALDGMFTFMLPPTQRLVSVARDHEPDYGRELAAWMQGVVGGTNREDLVFAAGLGPRALIDEWAAEDMAEFKASVLTPDRYFKDAQDWFGACSELEGMRSGEPSGDYLRKFLGSQGNAIGCKLLEAGDENGAWEVFWNISDDVDHRNFSAILNILGMIERGHQATKEQTEVANRRKQEVEERLKTESRLLIAMRIGGQVYVDPSTKAKLAEAKREAAARAELSDKAKEFIEVVSKASKDAKSGERARTAIYKALSDGMVRIESVGSQLLTIDMALGDVKSAERDAIEVLRSDRRHASANAVMGSLSLAHGDYVAAERYLRKALAAGSASMLVKNDLAYVLMLMGRYDEAEPFARETVRVTPAEPNFRETLAVVLIRGGKTEEGEQELDRAMEVASKFTIPHGLKVRFELDRMWLMKAKKNFSKLKATINEMRARKDLTQEERAEIEEIRK